MALQPVLSVVGLGDSQNCDLSDVSVLRLDMES